jgi:hypothetical protein
MQTIAHEAQGYRIAAWPVVGPPVWQLGANRGTSRASIRASGYP